MNSLVRYSVALIAAIVLFLVAIGGLLFFGLHSGERFQHLNAEFFAPSQQHITKSLRVLDQISFNLYQKSHSTNTDWALPYRFQMESDLKSIEKHLAELIRLRHEFDYEEAYGLPSKLYRQFEAARQRLASVPLVTDKNVVDLLDALAPLRNRLTQLERLYELDHLKLQEAEADANANYFGAISLAAVILVLVAVPLITLVALRFREALVIEVRSRSDLEKAKKDLEMMALSDSLTDLGNRHLFRARLEQAVGMTKRSDRTSALMYLDLDHFKRINDFLGHDAGDDVLKVVGARLRESVRAVDTVARLGGDEFSVIVADMANEENAATVAGKILDRIGEPIHLSGHELTITASIGITVLPTDGHEPTALMKNADMALYKAKESGRHTFQFFEEGMNRAIAEQTAMERELRSAIREERFELHYQPHVELCTGRVTCLEALIRWTKADGTAIPPDQFIPLAESTGLLPEIGDWVLRRACRDAAALHELGASDLRVAVNLSVRQFRDPNLISRVEQALLTAGLKPEFLELEITETTLIESIDDAINMLKALRRLGVAVAIDDFGVGYSSLNYLKQLPVDALKIDRTFVRDIEAHEQDRSIVDTILVMARNLSLRVIAEGIETKWQLHYLSDRHCDTGQGFLLSKPLPVEQISIPDINSSCARLIGARNRRLRLIDRSEELGTR